MTLTDALHRLQAWQETMRPQLVDAATHALLSVDVPALLAEAQWHADELRGALETSPWPATLSAAADWLAPREVTP